MRSGSQTVDSEKQQQARQQTGSFDPGGQSDDWSLRISEPSDSDAGE